MRDEVDHVVGVAILQEVEEGKEFLFIMCRSDATRTIDTLHIPVAEKGKAHSHKGQKDGPWIYEVQGDVLQVSPSVRWMGRNGEPDVFHNLGKWTVKFVRGGSMNQMCHVLNKSIVDEVQNHWRLYPKK